MKKIIGLAIPLSLGTIFLLYCISLVYAKDLSSENSILPEQGGPDWYDEDWNYRRPITILNNGASLPWYQVLVTLDAGNFNFSHTRIDGSDVRFTHSDGTTELSYWIESWDRANQLAYLWVRVPGIATGSNNIYLYYDNPQAVPVSDGTATFERFDDDWSQFSGEKFIQHVEKLSLEDLGVFSPFSWDVLSGTPDSSNGILSLDNGDGIISTSSHLYNAIGLRANFISGAGNKWAGFINDSSGPRTIIGDLPADPNNMYLIDYRNNLETVQFPRVGGEDWHNNFHIYEVRWNTNQSRGDIDHGLSTATSTQPGQVPDTSLPVTLYSYTGSNTTLMVDWAYIRQYRDLEPTTSVGTEQGLVALSLTNIDSPDPVQNDHNITYQLTITNTSEIDAPGVMVSDTLPENVTLGSIDISQGYCQPGSVILCYLNVLYSNSSAWVSINVTPTLQENGTITNTAVVSSPGYELNINDNRMQQATLVDSSPPMVNWQGPVQNGGKYYSKGGWVILEASAVDNDRVDWVGFKYYDHISSPPKWVIIGKDYTYPYQVQFNMDTLVETEAYQTFAYAADRAGNVSDPYNPLQRIFLVRKQLVFMPVIAR